jgi:two-component system response regulator FixJ
MPDRPPNVAVLDDEAEMRTALSRLLRARGFRVTPFVGGEEFLAATEIGSFDCIVLDLHMPGLSGFDVLSELAMRRPYPPVVVVTGHDVPGTRDRVQALGALEYLLKPVDQADLLAAIQRALHPHEPPVQPY